MLPQLSVCSERVSGEPEPEPVGEELWEQEMERLCSSREPVRALPYAMVDKRFIRWVPGAQDTAEAERWGWGRHREDAPVGWGRGNHQQWEDSLGPWRSSAWPRGHGG